MNAYQYAQQAGLTGTDQEIVDQLVASGVTATPIELAYLLEMLNFRNMLRKTDGSSGDERWKGTLQNLKSALIGLGLDDKVTAYEMWFSHVTNPRQSRWDTTRPEFAVPFWQMKLAFADQPSMPTSDDFVAVASLGGGWLFSDLTAEQYAVQRDISQLMESKRQLITEAASQYNEFVNAVDSWDGSGNAPTLGG